MRPFSRDFCATDIVVVNVELKAPPIYLRGSEQDSANQHAITFVDRLI